MSVYDSRRINAGRRLQLVLLLFVLWDALALLAGLTFGSTLYEISGDRMSGILATRASLGGIVLVPMALYIYAIVRGPQRHQVVLWAGGIEQGAGALFALYHTALKDVEVQGAVVPLVVSCVLFVLLMVNLPRGQVAS